MEINEKKTRALIINITHIYLFSTIIILKGDESIEIVDSRKIIGVTINNQLSWNKNTAILVRKVNQRMQLLTTVWTFNIKIPEMVHLLKVYCISVLKQSCAVW